MGTQRSIFFAVLITLPLFVGTLSHPIPENLRGGFFSLSRPFLSLSELLRDSVIGTFTHAKDFFFLYGENERLGKEVDTLKGQIVSLKENIQETERLKTLLDFKKATPARSVACEVIARDMSLLGSWALLGKGSRQGIKVEMPVVNREGLVGKVVEISPQTARVILLTDVGSKVSGLIQNTRDTGLILGDGSPFLKMKFIDADSAAKVGGLVVSSGLGGVYPKGIPIGKIEWIRREKNGLHLHARVKPAVSFSRLEEVLCLDYQPAN